VEQPLIKEFTYPLSGLERGIQLDKGFRPQKPRVKTVLNLLAEALVPDLDKAPNVCRILADSTLSQRRDIHDNLFLKSKAAPGRASGDGGGSESRFRMVAGVPLEVIAPIKRRHTRLRIARFGCPNQKFQQTTWAGPARAISWLLEDLLASDISRGNSEREVSEEGATAMCALRTITQETSLFQQLSLQEPDQIRRHHL
jgi:hypothetical protein